MSQLVLNFAAAALARDVGIRRVEESHAQWIDHAFATLQSWLTIHEECRIEQFRAWWTGKGGEQPLKPNAWGALGQKASRAGLIKFTHFAPAESPGTHAHPVRVYRSTVYRAAA